MGYNISRTQSERLYCPKRIGNSRASSKFGEVQSLQQPSLVLRRHFWIFADLSPIQRLPNRSRQTDSTFYFFCHNFSLYFLIGTCCSLSFSLWLLLIIPQLWRHTLLFVILSVFLFYNERHYHLPFPSRPNIY